MKFVRALQGIASFRVAGEEVFPVASPPMQNIIAGVQKLFNFGGAPGAENIGMGIPLVFQTGKIVKDNEEFGIQHLIMTSDGDMISSANTELADYALTVLIEYLNNEFGYTLNPSHRYYSSTIVVDFEKEIGDLIPSFKAIQKIIGDEGDENSFELLRIALSRGASRKPAPPAASPLDGVERTDFVIERRANLPFSANRFFCTAPMRTDEHIKALEKIEKLLTRV